MKKLYSVTIAILATAASAHASVDTSPKPGGVYKLKPGIYVEQHADCGSPANASIRQYDGKGIATAHTRSCQATVRSRRGNTYTVDQRCIDAGAGPAPRFTQRQQVVVQDALTFTQVIKGERATYRYCAVYQLPKELQKAPPSSARRN